MTLHDTAGNFSKIARTLITILLFVVVTLTWLPCDAQGPRLDDISPSQISPSQDPALNLQNESVAGEDEAKSWMDQIDDAFGKYLVAPVASVVFFDFGTGPQTITLDGVTTNASGWLKTESNPNGISIPFVVVWLLAGGVFLTFKMKFINLRAFWHALRLTKGDYDDPTEPGEVSHFQALATALSATVGLGNIAGVAIAIGAGGPGATFWMVLIGLLGMTTKFAECTLGQLYRTTDEDGHVMGGPMRYLKIGLEEKGYGLLGVALSWLFVIICVGASFGGGNLFQVNQSLGALSGDFVILQDQPWIYGLVMAIAVGAVIIGGIKSIGRVAGAVVPIMCLAYVLACLYILLNNFAEIPTAFGKIFSGAFNPDAAYGGFLGVLVIGIKRAVFSNEAGTGSAAIAHSAAKTDEPVSEGIVALLEPFIDTVVVCTMTALVIIITNAYSAPENADFILEDKGVPVTAYAFINGGFEWFKYILYVAVVLFAYSTCISWSYYGERCWSLLFGVRTAMIYRVLFCICTFLGSVITATNVKEFSDLMILGLALPNLLGVFILSGVVKRKLDDYWTRLESGEIVTHKEALARGTAHSQRESANS